MHEDSTVSTGRFLSHAIVHGMPCTISQGSPNSVAMLNSRKLLHRLQLHQHYWQLSSRYGLVSETIANDIIWTGLPIEQRCKVNSHTYVNILGARVTCFHSCVTKSSTPGVQVVTLKPKNSVEGGGANYPLLLLHCIHMDTHQVSNKQQQMPLSSAPHTPSTKLLTGMGL